MLMDAESMWHWAMPLQIGREMRRAGIPFWSWLTAVLLGPFVPFITAPLGAMVFDVRSSYPPGSDWRGLEAMIYFGLPLWALVIIIMSVWLANRVRKSAPEAVNDVTGSGFLLSFLGIIASGVWGFAACGLLATAG
jgi:hypothetical protein